MNKKDPADKALDDLAARDEAMFSIPPYKKESVMSGPDDANERPNRQLTSSGHPIEKFPDDGSLAQFPDDTNLDRDPWKHRSSGMKCSSCMWYVQKEGDPARPAPTIGRCRRHAPTMNGYPVVYPTDWCGDHKLDESKL
jgi:hypothetical protein